MIKPINFSSKILIPQNFLTKTKKVKKLNATAIPFVTAPIVAYWSTQKNKELREKTINNEIEKSKKLNSSHHPVKDTTETNTEALKKADFTDSEIAQHLNSKGEIKDQETKDLLKSKHIKFKGSTDDQHFDIEAQDKFVLSNDEVKILNEMGNIDIRMDPVLQEIHDAPPLDTVEGLMTSIFGEIPAGVHFDWDLWKALKEIANDIIDIGDWM